MYTKADLKKVVKKSTKLKNSLIRAQLTCNTTHYTEQNTEELNDVKDYLTYKIDLLNEIITLADHYFAGQLNCTVDELFETLNFYKKQFNDLSKDARLSRLQQIYTRKITDDVVDL